MARVLADDVSLVSTGNGPYLVNAGRTVLDDPPGGNANGRFDPGETGGLVVALRNVGNQPVSAVQAVLRSTEPLFAVTDSTADYGDIAACSTRTNAAAPFGIAVDPSIPLETPVLCHLLVTGTGYCDTLRFTITVGEIRNCDPIPDGPRRPAEYWAYDDADTLYTQHPEFNWVEINGIGTLLTMGDDQTDIISLPPDFIWRYYGQDYNEISICSNGWVGAGANASTSYINTGLPDASAPAAAVCAVWDDLYPPTGNGVWYYYDAANRRMIVEWDSVGYLGQTNQDKFEIIIADTAGAPDGVNPVTVQYLTANGYNYCTAGLQDATMSIGIQCLFDNSYHRGCNTLVPGSAIKYTTATPSTAVSERREAGVGAWAVRAFPNPFTGTTTIRLSHSPLLTANSSLSVCDISGRLVRTFLNSSLLPPHSSLVWNGTDNSGRRVAPGIYFVHAGPEAKPLAKLVLTR
jgi:hypothetical protein